MEAVAELGLGTLSSAGQNTDDFPRGCIAWMEGSQVYGSYWNEPVHWSRGKGSSTHRPLCFGPHPGPPPSPPPSSPPVFYVLGLAQERLCPPPHALLVAPPSAYTHECESARGFVCVHLASGLRARVLARVVCVCVCVPE